ncbi:hypothetical protein SLEP1_g49648 [Rubroshorea leprosula]|uniref:Uncharacterized protein n=1 Tax=Rubroshorea leprosula TaxID=152421 RepID=A0AAV5LXF6_9ROSI|nr:hypothetical protein SLEP1_g49648 [Rubroshorea leprosula]
MVAGKYGGCCDNELRDWECVVSRKELVNSNEYSQARNGSHDIE